MKEVLPADLDYQGLKEAVGRRLEDVHWQVRHREIGTVVQSGDGVASVRGLPSARYGELVETEDNLFGMIFDVRPDVLGVLFLDPSDHISAGAEVRATGRVASVAVGDELLGRVVDPLGRPLDGGLPIRSRAYREVEREAPSVADRIPVTVPLSTGTKLIDGLLPIGRGQRELLLGDRATGKTSIALDAILAQRDTEVICVYAAIGQRTTTVTEALEALRDRGSLSRCVVVVADADSAAGQQYLAPYTACTIAESFMEQGKHVLVVYDNLTKHADVYRRVGLLFGRPPGREAYPSDVFYLHARLLERATQLRDDLGGGSLTALPIADTQGGNIASYIPTNLISITDGQIYLDNRLFNEGIRPAVDVGLSVSRVGGKAQPPLLRALSGDLRLVYAQLGELETFARFGAKLEPEARKRLERGRRLREALKQRRLNPLRLGDQLATIFAVREGYLDRIPVERVEQYLDAVYEALAAVEQQVLVPLERASELDEELEGRLRQILGAAQQHCLNGASS